MREFQVGNFIDFVLVQSVEYICCATVSRDDYHSHDVNHITESDDYQRSNLVTSNEVSFKLPNFSDELHTGDFHPPLFQESMWSTTLQS